MSNLSFIGLLLATAAHALEGPSPESGAAEAAAIEAAPPPTQAPPEFAPEPMAPTSARLSGQVVDDFDLPIPGVSVELVREGASLTLTTDGEGRFAQADLAPGAWTIQIRSGVFEPLDADADLAAGDALELTLRLAIAGQGGGQSAPDALIVTGRRETSQVVERVLSTDVIAYLPGTNGDVVKAVQNLPGVLRPPLGVGQLIIRGAAPEDSAYYLDGGQIPLVFHFAGLSTVINGDSLEEVAYMPGAYGVRYGRQIGGAVELRADRDLPEENRTYASVDVYQAAAFTERRLNDRTAISLSGRRSYIDAVLSPVLSQGDSQVQAPRYWDAQARLQRETARGDSLDAMLFVSDDRFQVLGEEGSVQIGLGTRFAKLRLRYDRALAAGWAAETVLIAGPDEQYFAFDGDGEAWERALLPQLRQELRREATVGGAPGWRFGLDVVGGWEGYRYDIPSFGDLEAGASWIAAPGAYAEMTWTPGRLKLIPGVRADLLAHEEGLTGPAIDPRLAARFALLDDTTLKAGGGIYSGFPALRELLSEGDGSPDLGPERSIQFNAGIEQDTAVGLSVELTGFYNQLDDLVSGREARFEFFTGPPPVGPFDEGAYANDGTGRIYGAEALLRYESDRSVGLIAATLSRSERTDRPGEEVELFRYDQPVVINALFSRQFERGWRLGARARTSSGYAYTPVVNRWYDLDSRSFVPVYGERSSERLSPFFSLDLRVDKEWQLRRFDLTTYLDVQNATNNTNPEVIAWTYDYGAEAPIESLPLVPAFGVKGEW